MSLRALKKLNKQSLLDDLERYVAPVSEDEESEEEEQVQPRKVNAFALLGMDDEEDEDEAENDDENIEKDTNEAEIEVQSEPEVSPVPVSAPKTTKKKKKKGKKKKSTPKMDQVEENSDDELDRILNELKIKEQGASLPQGLEIVEDEDMVEDRDRVETVDDSFMYFTVGKFEKCLKLIQVDPINLDPDTEFKNLFGADLSNSAIEDADTTSSTSMPPELLLQIKELAKRMKNWGGKDRRTVPGSARKLTFAKIRDDWIPSRHRVLTMDELDTREVVQMKCENSEDWTGVVSSEVQREHNLGVRYFGFKRNIENKELNTRVYLSLTRMPDHEGMIRLLQQNPYNVEIILLVASILFRQGDKSNSNGLLERALFVFDWGLKQNFKIGSGLMRLPYEFFLNRQFYLSCFRYIELLTQRSTFYTALQYCIFMLSLNPTEDPIGVRYFIDFYAIMSGEYRYLINFTESPLTTTYIDWMTPGLCYSKVLAYLLWDYEKNEDKAKLALKEAFQLYPYTGLRLLEVVGLDDTKSLDQLDEEPSIFDKVAAEAYVIRAPVMWGQNPKVQAFVRNELTQLMAQKGSGQQKGSFFSSFFGRKPAVEERSVPVNLIRHVILSGESKVMAKLPQNFWDEHKESTYEFDVLPPTTSHSTHFEDEINEQLMEQLIAFQGMDEDEIADLLGDMIA